MYRVDPDGTLWTITKEWKHIRGERPGEIIFSLKKSRMTESQVLSWISPAGTYPSYAPTTAEHFSEVLAELKNFVAGVK